MISFKSFIHSFNIHFLHNINMNIGLITVARLYNKKNSYKMVLFLVYVSTHVHQTRIYMILNLNNKIKLKFVQTIIDTVKFIYHDRKGNESFSEVHRRHHAKKLGDI